MLLIAPRSLPRSNASSRRATRPLVGNTGYRRFLASSSGDRFIIDHAKAAEDTKFDGVFVLRTNTDLTRRHDDVVHVRPPRGRRRAGVVRLQIHQNIVGLLKMS